MESAKLSVSLIHQVVADVFHLCQFYANKIKFKDEFASFSLLLLDETEEESKKRSQADFNQMLLQRQSQQSSPMRDIPFNILEESISMIERTAIKLLPIIRELGARLAGARSRNGEEVFASLTKACFDPNQLKSVDMEKELEKERVLEELNAKKEKNDLGLLLESDKIHEEDLKELEDIEKTAKN
jgi:hypothetical protein